jgi:hypothetical protein
MKIFFSLLLLANIGFGLMQWLLPYEQLFVENSKIELAEELKLLKDPIKSAAAETNQSPIKSDSSNPLVEENAAAQPLCYTIGPFKDKTRALEVSGRYSTQNIKTQLKSKLEKEYMGVMVYISGHKTREEAIARGNKLARQGIRDRIIINEQGKSNVLSLGVFGLKKNADRLTARLKKLKYPVETEPRYRDRTIYWLYYQQSNESDLPLLLDDQDAAKGIGQIPRQC